uniref:TRP domain-containing protein n=1 Tax=Steinernema glaseri TaxID=37863 RepID=A0A1I7YGP8_9BILA
MYHGKKDLERHKGPSKREDLRHLISDLITFPYRSVPLLTLGMCSEGGCLYRAAEKQGVLVTVAILTLLPHILYIGAAFLNLGFGRAITAAVVMIIISILGIIIHVFLFCAIAKAEKWLRAYVIVIFYIIFTGFTVVQHIVSIIYISAIAAAFPSINEGVITAVIIIFVVVLLLNVSSWFIFIPYHNIAKKRFRATSTNIQSNPVIVEHQSVRVGQPVFIEPAEDDSNGVLPGNVESPPPYTKKDLYV